MDNSAKTPAHLWIIGVLSLLWNGFGAFDYVMTQTRNQAYLAQFTDAQRAYFESFPALAVAAWACGVWGALAGSLLLLARSRHAVTAFAVSLAGLAVSSIYQYGLSTPPADLVTGAMIGVNVVISIGATGLLVYAILMRRSGILR